MSHSDIPKHISTLLSAEAKGKMTDIRKRKLSVMSTRATSSNVSEFLDAKIHELELEFEYTEQYRNALMKAYETNTLSEKDWNRTRKEIRANVERDKKEYIALKPQRHLLEEDFDEDSAEENLEYAYAKAMVNRVKMPKQLNTKEKNLKSHVQEKFRKEVVKYYGVESSNEGQSFLWCAVTQRDWKPKETKAAHIVPKTLESEELAYLFGAGEMDLSDPRNGTFFLLPLLKKQGLTIEIVGLILHRNIEEALDRAQIAIVPIPSALKERTRWKVLLIDDRMKNQVAITVAKHDFIRWGVSSLDS